MSAVRQAARAKINLFLHILGRRDDGYHELDSLVAFADVQDEVAAVPADRLTLTIDGPFADALTDAGDNLVLGAARALAKAADRPSPGAALALTKRLPVASGIGGGSADAAATLKALTRMWGIDLPADRLAALALDLGADVPVCLVGRATFMGGIGETLEPVTLPPVPAVLVNPGVAVSTGAVFRSLDMPPPPAPPTLTRFPGPPPTDAHGLAAWLTAETRNDLAAPAIAQQPVIAEVLDALARRQGCLLARMSGSGATCFGLFTDTRAASAAAQAITGAHSTWWVTATALRAG